MRLYLIRTALLCCMTLFACQATCAQVQPAAAQSAGQQSGVETPRPKIALVLSGGGARGFAHIGVLKVLNELKVPVDIVVGTSMGAVIGGAWSAGRTVDELQKFVQTADWAAVVSEAPRRNEQSFRRREEDLLLPSRLEFGLDRSGLSLPPSTSNNVVLERELSRLLPNGLTTIANNQLPLAFRSIATDLRTGELVDLRDAPLFMALRASMAVPGVFAPVTVQDRLLVDGGLVRNLPVDVARSMGADIIIAVNVGTPASNQVEFLSALGVAQQMLKILTEQNVQRSLNELTDRDVLVAPALEGFGFLDFRDPQRAIAAGEAAARRVAARLAKLAVSDIDYTAWADRRTTLASAGSIARPLAQFEIKGTERVNPQALLTQSGLKTGANVTPEQVQAAASKLQGSGDFERVDVQIADVDGKRAVTFTPQESAWTRNRLRLGLELSSDFNDSNRFSIGAMHVLPWINSWGGELRTVARIGTRRAIGTQLWQPLSPGSDWFVAPALQYDSSASDLFENNLRTARIAFATRSLTLAAGRQLGDWGTLQVGVRRALGQGQFLIPEDPGAGKSRFSDTARFAELQIDTLESLSFPRKGAFATLRWEQSPRGPDQTSLARSTAIGLKAFELGEWAGHVYGEWSRSQQGFAPLSLGGFLRLSGTPENSIRGEVVALGRVVIARRVGAMPTGLGGSIHTGLSFEAGSAFARGQSVKLTDLKGAVSAFAAVDTRFGPLYVGYGISDGKRGSVYLFLGPYW